MPDSIALTRIHTPEDYWNRMYLARDQLCMRYLNFLHAQPAKAKLCIDKATQIEDRYHERWTMTKREYNG